MRRIPVQAHPGGRFLRAVILAAASLGFAVLLALSSSCGSDPPQAPRTPTLEDTIDELVRPCLDFGSPSGLIIGLTRHGERTVLRYANAELGYEVPRRDGLFEITSLTKTFTATLLAQLIQDNLVRLDDPVDAYLPEDVEMPTCEGEPIRIRHLVTHTAGLPMLPPGSVEGSYTEQQVLDCLENLASGSTTFCEPTADGGHVPLGVRMRHSEVGYAVLGMVIERITGRPLGELLRERVCDPLGLGDTRDYGQLDDDQRTRLINAYEVDGTELDFWRTTRLDGACGLAASIDDLLQYLEACMAPDGPLGDVLSMTQEPLFWNYGLPGDSTGIGMAWSIFRSAGRQVYGQRGWRNMTCVAYFWPERKTALVLISTTRQHWPIGDALAAEIWAEIEELETVSVP